MRQLSLQHQLSLQFIIIFVDSEAGRTRSFLGERRHPHDPLGGGRDHRLEADATTA
jgi:hypothetical protein